MNNNLFIFNSKHNMNKFLKGLVYFTFPFIVILSLYLALDPFMVLRDYDVVFDPKAKGWIGINKDYLSTRIYEKNYQKQQYNAFIFGNSRSIFYEIKDWQKHIDSNSNCFHFDGSGEALYALHKKIVYLESKKAKIKNCLLVLDYEILMQDKPKSGHLFMISPQLESVGKNVFGKFYQYSIFHLANFKGFLSPLFLFTYFDFKISGEVKPYMIKNFLLNDKLFQYDSIHNEQTLPMLEKKIADGKFFTAAKLSDFPIRDSIAKYYPRAIKDNQIILLEEIVSIFRKNKTNYKIIISPNYDQEIFNREDLTNLNEIFGKENVFDFSGKNKFTEDYHDYYEAWHYRPHIAREVMNLVYKRN